MSEIKTDITESMNSWGLSYAWDTLLNRALTDETGLKPVQLRTLYGMYKMGSRPDKPTIKAVRVSGEIVGKYHPHGPSSVEGAMERMAQHFAMRVPLLKYQGSVGVSTGDNAPSARYWEAGLNKAAWELLKDIKNNACQWTYTESGDNVIPVQIPVRFPVGVINGMSGIATGFASNFPQHNPDEVMNACIAYLKGKVKKPEDVLRYITAPDFCTGGLILGTDGVRDYLTTGIGKFFIRGVYEVKHLERGRTAVIFSELPYAVSCQSVISAINAQRKVGNFTEVSEVKDLTDRKYQTNKSEVHLVIYLKSGVNVERFIRRLFQKTPCQVSFSVNATTIIDQTPHQNTTALEMIEGFCKIKREAFIRKSNFRLSIIKEELHTLEGLLKILTDLDKAITIIRKAEDGNTASQTLQKVFIVDEEQAEQILAMPLRKLTKQDTKEINDRKNDLVAEQEELKAVLSDETLLTKQIICELKETKKVISSPRRSRLLDVTLDDLKNEEKLQKKLERSLQSGTDVFIHFDGNSIYKSLEKESGLKAFSTGTIYAVEENGTLTETQVSSIPLDSPQKVVGKPLGYTTKADDTNTLLISNLGNVTLVKNVTLKSPICRLKEGEELIFTATVPPDCNDDLFFVTKAGDCAKLPISLFRAMGAGSGLVTGVKMSDIIFAGLVKDINIVKTVTDKKEVKYTSVEDCPARGKGAKGYCLHKTKGKVTEVHIFPHLTEQMKLTERGAKA